MSCRATPVRAALAPPFEATPAASADVITNSIPGQGSMITISRLYDTYDTAADAVAELERAGIPGRDISIIANNSDNWYDRDGEPRRDDRSGNAGTGAGIGAALGGVAGLLAGLGMLAIPGLGPVVAAGWLVSAGAVALAGGVAGGVIGALTTAGVSEEEAHVYAEG